MFCIRKVDAEKIFSLYNTVNANLLNKGAWHGLSKETKPAVLFSSLFSCTESLLV